MNFFLSILQASRSVDKVKRRLDDSDEDDVPLMARKKVKKESKKRKEESDEEDFKPVSNRKKSKSFMRNINGIIMQKENLKSEMTKRVVI